MLSIITITKNNLDGLKATHASLDAQILSSNEHFEWIVIDGASIDASLDYLKTRTKKYIRCKVISEKDAGIYDAMNKGIKHASGTHLLFLNAGDQLAQPNTLHGILGIINNKPDIDFIYGDSFEEDNYGQLYYKKAYNHKYVFWGMFTHHQAMVFKKNDTLFYDERLKVASDYGFVIKHLKNSKTIQTSDHPICVFKRGGLSQTDSKKGRVEQLEIRKKEYSKLHLFCYFVYGLQMISCFTRQKIPILYSFLRHKKVSKKRQ